MLIFLSTIQALCHTEQSCYSLFTSTFERWGVGAEDLQFLEARNVKPNALAVALSFIDNFPPALALQLGVTIGYQWQTSIDQFLTPLNPEQSLEETVPKDFSLPDLSMRMAQLQLAMDYAQYEMTSHEKLRAHEVFTSSPNLLMLASMMLNLPPAQNYKLPENMAMVEARIKAFLTKRLNERPPLKHLLENSTACFFATNRIVQQELKGTSRNVAAEIEALSKARLKSARDIRYYPLFLREIVDQQLHMISSQMAANRNGSVNLYALSREFIERDARDKNLREFEWALALEVGLGVPTYSPTQVLRLMRHIGQLAVKEIREERLEQAPPQNVALMPVKTSRPAQWFFPTPRGPEPVTGIGYRIAKPDTISTPRVESVTVPLAFPILPEKFKEIKADQKYLVTYRDPLDSANPQGVVSFTRQLLRDLPKMTDEKVPPDKWLILIRLGRARKERDEGIKILIGQSQRNDIYVKSLNSVMRLFGEKKGREIVFTRLGRGH